uniref:SFRP (Secreted Frizzled related protein) n=1 Tax=Clytia hemisphaerica TaxID=252671 RepID=A0A069DLR6_9CNID
MNQLQLLCLAILCTVTFARYAPSYQRCEPVRVEMCRNLDPKNWVRTSFPNFMNHSSSIVAERELKQYYDIIDSNCSPYLTTFLCSLYMPICKAGIGRIPPCKSLCQAARSGCEPLLNSAHIRWPYSMNCDQFPDSGQLCIDLPETAPTPKALDEVEANQIPSKRTVIKKDKLPSIAKKDLKPLEEVVLECPADKPIMVRKIRHFPERNTDCCPVDSTEKISRGCNGKQKCEIILDENVIGHGCVTSMEKTFVKYKCVGLQHNVKTRKSIGCRKNNKNGI